MSFVVGDLSLRRCEWRAETFFGQLKFLVQVNGRFRCIGLARWVAATSPYRAKRDIEQAFKDQTFRFFPICKFLWL
jgi:hypothetical protein